MELASRTFGKRNVNGLTRCIERDGTIHLVERKRWQAVKDKGKNLFDPNRGGSYTVFDQRPLSEEVKDYCTQDVTFMREVYRRRLCDAWLLKFEAETEARIRLSQSPSFDGKGQHMALGPPRWLHWTPRPAEARMRTLLQATSPRRVVYSSSLPPIGRGAKQESTNVEEKLVDIMQCLALAGETVDQDHDDKGDEASTLCLRERSFPQHDRDESSDFTACDRVCGYCGQCDY